MGAVRSPSTDFWPGSRSGVSNTITPSTRFQPSSPPPQAEKSRPAKAHSKTENFFMSSGIF